LRPSTTRLVSPILLLRSLHRSSDWRRHLLAQTCLRRQEPLLRPGCRRQRRPCRSTTREHQRYSG